MFVGQWFSYKIFGVLKGMEIDPVLPFFAITPAAEGDWDARPDSEWGLYTFDEENIFVLLSFAPLRRTSFSGEQIGEGGMLM